MKNRFLQWVRPADLRGVGRPFNARAWLLLSLCAAATLLLGQNLGDEELLEHTVVKVPIEQIGRYSDDADPFSIKWSRAAMHDPHVALQLREKFKTQERKDAEEEALLAITDPDAFRKRKEAAEAARGPKTPSEQAAEAQAARDRAEALRVILNPVETAREKEATKSAAMRRREAIAEQAILHPREFNEIVDKHKSLELRQKEADALHAFSDPERFLAERLQFKKTGSKQDKKHDGIAAGAADDGQPKNGPRPNRPEKGTEGGSR